MDLSRYCDGRPPSVGNWTRLTTQRLIVPGYDRVFIDPLVVFARGLVVPQLLLAIGIPPALAAAISVAATVCVALNAGPTIIQWNYTGHHRIVVDVFEPQRRA